MQRIIEFLEDMTGQQHCSIVYTHGTETSEKVAAELRIRGLAAKSYQAGKWAGIAYDCIDVLLLIVLQRLALLQADQNRMQPPAEICLPMS